MFSLLLSRPALGLCGSRSSLQCGQLLRVDDHQLDLLAGHAILKRYPLGDIMDLDLVAATLELVIDHVGQAGDLQEALLGRDPLLDQVGSLVEPVGDPVSLRLLSVLGAVSGGHGLQVLLGLRVVALLSTQFELEEATRFSRHNDRLRCDHLDLLFYLLCYFPSRRLSALGRCSSLYLDLLLSGLIGILIRDSLVDDVDLELDRVALLADLVHDLVLLLLLLIRLGLDSFRVWFLGGGFRVHLDLLLLLRFGKLEKELVGLELRLVVEEGAGELEGATLHVDLARALALTLVEGTGVDESQRLLRVFRTWCDLREDTLAMTDAFNDLSFVVCTICVEDCALTVWPVVFEGTLICFM